MLYYTLIIKENNTDKYYIAFGDYDLESVRDELKNEYQHYYMADIICTNDDQESIDHCVAKWNS